MKNAHRNKLAAALLLAAIAAPVTAGSGTSSLVVSATVVDTCAIGTGTMSFDTRAGSRYPATGTAGTLNDIDTGTGRAISINCTNGASATISADDGANAAGAGARRMKSAALQAAVKGEYTDTVNLTITYTP